MKKIYIVLTYTGTVLAKIVKLYTKKEYSHVSISLDKKLTKMYSFGRLNPYNPFIGGLVKESPEYGTFKRFKNTTSQIYSINVTDQEYYQIKKLIKKMYSEKDNYRFNVLGLIAVLINKRLNRENCFYCAEFVKYILESSNLNVELPNVIKPDDFRQLDGLSIIYEGKLNKYNM